MKEAKKPPPAAAGGKPQSEADKQHLDDELTRALKDTFPASDPPAVIQPPHSKHDKDGV